MKYKSFVLLLSLIKIIIVIAPIPNWTKSNQGIEISSETIEVYNKYNHGYTIKLTKTITKTDNIVKVENKVTDGSTTQIVDFDDIGGHFGDGFYTVNKLIICPKGKFHPYDFYNNKYIPPPNNFADSGDWDLRCFYHKSNHFLVFYFQNGYSKFFAQTKDATNGNEIRDYSMKGSELYGYIVEDAYSYDSAYTNNEQYKFPIIVNEGGLKLIGSAAIMNKLDHNVNLQYPNSEKYFISLKDHSQAYFDSNNYIYYFTYNDINDFTSGYTTKALDFNNYNSDSVTSITYNENPTNPLSFLDNVEIKSMKFIAGTQYIYYKLYYKLYDSDTSKYLYGLIDIKLNKVLYNIEEAEDATFIPYDTSTSPYMLLITSTSAYKMCIVKNGNSCLETCSSGSLYLDASGNYCSTSCLSGKIKLMPEDICISESECDTTKYILQNSVCGLCSYFNPNGAKYRLIGSDGCLDDKPNNSEDYNSNLYLLKCKTDYKVDGTSCVPETCYETCLKCSEVSSNPNDQKCTSCNDGYQLDNGNCIIIPTTEKIIPTTEKIIPTTEKIIPTTEKIIPTTEKIIPTTEEAKTPTTEKAITPTTITPTTEKIETPSTSILTEAPTTIAPITQGIIEQCRGIGCHTCTEESNENELCITCKGGYKPVNYTVGNFSKYFKCLEEKDVETKYYEENGQYKPCYKTCLKCSGPGNVTDHHCDECGEGYMERPGDNPKNNCVMYSPYYYIGPYNEYKPLQSPQCPEEAKFQIVDIISNKSSCIYDCKADSEYKYLYNGQCLKNCSFAKDTIPNDNFICEENPNTTHITNNILYIDTTDTIKIIQTLAMSYAQEFNYTEKHISEYITPTEDLKVLLYKNPHLIGTTDLKAPDIDFKECYEKVKKAYNLTQDLIIAIADKKDKYNPSTFYLFFHPVTGLKLEAGEICKDDTIEVKENILNFLDEKSKNYELQTALTQQGINIFDINDPYYKDICYDFVNPKNRDMALKDRIKETYVNVSLCDEGCVETGIDIKNNVASCDCKFNDVTNNELIHENAALEYIVGEFFELINSSNILVLKCYKNLLKYFTRSKGGMLIITLFALTLICACTFLTYELTKMKRYIFSLTESFTSFLAKYPNLCNFFPPKRKSIKNKTDKVVINFSQGKSDDKRKSIRKKSKLNTAKSTNPSTSSKKLQNSRDLIIYNKRISLNPHPEKYKVKEKSKEEESKLQNEYLDEGKRMKKYFKDYLATELDDMEFDDAIKKDKRSFCEYFCDDLKEKQSFAYTFIASDPINTRTIKLILFFLNITLYFVVNGLFFSESYISELYHMDNEDEKFYSFIPRTIDKMIYTTLVAVAIGYLTDFFFLDEKKVKGIFKREKGNRLILKRSIAMLIREIQSRYISFIVLTIILFAISLYYVSCFNYVYPKTQEEWIKSSVLIIIIMQILSILKCLYETIFRFLSFKYESEKLYKAGKIFESNS